MVITTVAAVGLCDGESGIVMRKLLGYSILVEGDLIHRNVPPAVAPQHNGFPLLEHQPWSL